MNIPHFNNDQVNPALLGQDLGTAFQLFVHELKLPEYQGLHVFPGAGKDGAIDLCQTLEGYRVVFECKHIGEGGFKEAQKRWRSVAKKLQKHLAHPSGPTKGQLQYEPWYNADPAIKHFFFCISCELANQQQFDELQTEIFGFFRFLAKQREHLKHLAQLSVTILDWNDLYTHLHRLPRLMFRWFPKTCPEGLVLFDEFPDDGTFRSYLASAKLPYYSFAEHLMKHAVLQGTDILNEEDMLNQLIKSNNTGLVITGMGGIGKTRFMLELGKIAKKKGWLVLRVLSRLTIEAIEQLTSLYTSDTYILLLIDYIELQRYFPVIVETLHDLNDTYDSRFRYIATCRTSYYPAISAISRQMQVRLPPDNTEKVLSWFKGYCQERICHILRQSGLPPTPERIAICYDIPILAVFLSYLHSRGLDPNLSALLGEQNFGAWVAKRINLSFTAIENVSVYRSISLLISLFPMTSSNVGKITQANYGELFDKLATDGWVEKLPADESKGIDTWATIHDVIADQIISSYLSSIPKTVDRFADNLLSLAIDIGCLRSALQSLQRLQSELASLNWPAIFTKVIKVDPTCWLGVRDILLQTPLLTPSEIVDLFTEHFELWRAAEREADIQGSLGMLARRILTNPEQAPDHSRLGTIVSWMREAARHARNNTFILRWGIQLDFDAFSEGALQHIITQTTRLSTQYLLCAWLKSSGNKELIKEHIEVWLGEHAAALEAGFVYAAWLDAKGDIELVREHLEVWLGEHAAALEADFVYKAWLDAKGDIELVREHLEVWLGEHAAALDTQFVYKAWLDAKGDIELVRKHLEVWLGEHAAALEAGFVYAAWLDAKGDIELVREHLEVWLGEHAANYEADFVFKAWLEAGGEFAFIKKGTIDWLHENREREDAVYLTKFISKEKDIPIGTIKDILVWCRSFPSNEDSLWRLTRLEKHLLLDDVSEDVLRTSEVILQPRISGSYRLKPEALGQINTLFSYLICADHFAKGDLRVTIDTLFLHWLRNPRSFGSGIIPHTNIQRASYFKRVVDLIVSGTLDLFVDREPLERFLNWVAMWQPQRKSQLKEMLHFLKTNYPSHGLWEILD
jgi:hypothetical protein